LNGSKISGFQIPRGCVE